jgi:hypothetical protein
VKITQRSTNARASGVYNINHTLPNTPVSQWNDITHENADNCCHASTPNALINLTNDKHVPYSKRKTGSYSCRNQLIDILCKATEQVPRAKNRIGKEQALLPSKDITQFSI